MINEQDIEKTNRENFRSCLEALARPGQEMPLKPLFDSNLLAVASVFLYAEVSYSYQGEQNFKLINAVCGAQPTTADKADYLFFDHPDPDFLVHAKIGSPENPDNGATILFRCPRNPHDTTETILSGPGIQNQMTKHLPISPLFVEILKEKNESFPMGVDLFFIHDSGTISALPRTTKIEVHP